MQRVYDFENVRNFRDMGGYASRFGGIVVTGRLFRSAHYGEATQADLLRLKEMPISVQADLRRPDERERFDGKWKAPRQITHDGGREHEAPHAEFLNQVEADADKAHEWMRDYYRTAPYKEHHVAMFREWFEALEALADGEAALVNCAAGKDRTGLLCAMTHHILGVSEEDIRADYLLTNTAANVDERLPEAAEYFNSMLGKTYDPEVFRPFLGVELDLLNAAFAQISEQSGSLDGYLSDVLAVTEARKETLRTKFIA